MVGTNRNKLVQLKEQAGGGKSTQQAMYV